MHCLRSATRFLVSRCQPPLCSRQISISAVKNSDEKSIPMQQNPITKYESYPEYDTPSPFKRPGPRRYGFKSTHFTGGPLPRLDGPDVKPLPTGNKFKHKDMWTKKEALFGQNDYIDILGDGDVHPRHLMRGPQWLVGFRGNELQRLVRWLHFEGHYIKEFYPTRYHSMSKQIMYLYRRYNQRRKHDHSNRTAKFPIGNK